jgi:glycosyltransferase involved in cell wall biosynthesis
LGGATGITATSESFLNWGLRNAGRAQRSTDGVFPLGYPPADPSDRIAVERLAWDLASRFGFSKGEFLVTFVGTFNSSCNFDTVFQAACLLRGEGVRIVMVGGGDVEAGLRSRAEDLPNVIFTGWLDRLSVRAILSLSAAGLAPYREGASQTLPNKLFEYLNSGIPIVSSLEGEMKEIVGKEGIGINYKAGDASSLAEAIRYLASNRSACLEMGDCAHRLFEREYNYEAVYPRLAIHLEEMVLGRERDFYK